MAHCPPGHPVPRISMPQHTSRPSLIRSRSNAESHRVSFVELFFDLVFVFAITQIAHGLIDHPDGGTFARTLVLTMAMWWVWVYTTWSMNWLSPERSLIRVVLIAAMLIVLLMSSAIPEAFDEGQGLIFALGYVGLQLGRAVLMAAVVRSHDASLSLSYIRTSIWFAMSAVLWILGGLAPSEERLYLWAVAITIDLLAPLFRYWLPVLGSTAKSVWVVSGEYMAERTGLFIIVVLGETIIVTGAAFGELVGTPTQVSAFLSAFASTVLMWLLYFAHDESRGRRFINASQNAAMVARSAYTWAPVVLVLGLVLTAVADELVLFHPGDNIGTEDQYLPTNLLIWVASSVYLLGNLLFKRAIGRPWLASHIAGILALTALFAASNALSPLAMNWASNAVLLAVIVWDYRTRSLSESNSDDNGEDSATID
ncbi:low temperature requirement protein A [Arthrobacter frigidicola]|nr:low temperature requirement protein A [Arthrobacter frigidicola]